MARRAAISFVIVLLILLTMGAAFYIDQTVVPYSHFVSALFLVPVLIAAAFLPTRAVIVTAILSFVVALFSAYLSQTPLEAVILELLGFLVASTLAILLGHQYRVAIRLAREAQNARNTLEKIVETLPAGVVVSDPQGTFTLANTTANTILGGKVTGTAYGPSDGYRLESPDGTPFPPHDLPLPRAIECGETTRDVEIRVLAPDRAERVILAAGSPIRDEEGRVTAAIAVFQDITERVQMEQALRAGEESMARAQQVAHVGNWDRDLRTGQIRWSDEVYRIFGISPTEFAGTFAAFLQCVHPADRTLVTQALAEALTKGNSYSIDHRIVRPDGSVHYAHEEAQVLRDANGHPIRLVGTIQDITERKRSEEERERLLEEVQIERAREEAIVNSSANGIIFVDAASGYVQANPAAIQLFGHPFVPEEGQAQYLSQLVRPDGLPITLDELPTRRALTGQTTVEEELVVVQPNGTRVPVLDSSALVCLPGGQVVGAVAVLQNMSAFKQLERLREEWTSIVAHDLRQPVTVIVGYATSLLRKEANVSVEQRAKIAHILTAAQNLNKLVADLLDVSRIEARRLVLQLQPTDLPKLVANVVERMSTAEASTEDCQPIQVDVVGSIPPVVADPMRIEQVLGNLLSNAVKYGTPNTEITIKLRQQDDNALVSVTNQGPGIPPDEVGRIFTRFYRAREARDGRVVGLGLGLYITQGIVEAHHGRIWVESIPNQTTTFSFTLPLASPANGKISAG